jgi:geranylgeranyl pyrophosphate synthase
VSGHPPEVAAPAAATLAAGGKRLRPLLVFCSAPQDGRGRSGEEAQAGLVAAATAVELVHMATLVHDDLIDGAAIRRGRPTVAAARGPAAAITTGDFLFARAFAELTTTRSAAAVRTLAAAALELSRGEMEQGRAAFRLDLTEADYLARCRRKTAALFAAACRLGAMLGGASAEAQDRLAAFGENVGMAFQIFDDILDLAGAPAATGKRRGTDLCDGTITLPVILAMRMEPSLREAVAAARPGPALDALCDRLARHPGLAAARARALRFVQEARASIAGPLDGADTAALARIADGVVDRYS